MATDPLATVPKGAKKPAGVPAPSENWEAAGHYVRTARNADGSGGFMVAECSLLVPGASDTARLFSAARELQEVTARWAMAMWQSGIKPVEKSDAPLEAILFDTHTALFKATGRDVVADTLEAICAGNRAAIATADAKPALVMHPVTSSNIVGVGHDGTDLFVAFKNATYRYEAVPVETFEALRAAPSVGQFLNATIKPKFKAVKVEAQS
jgi:hypothetical protein